MKLSREAQYGLAAAVHLAGLEPGTMAQAADVARALALSPTFVAKALQKLSRAGLVRSSRGGIRGYALSRPAREISVRSVVEAIDSDVFRRCVFWSDRCSETRPCLLHPVWRTVRPRVVEVLDRVTVQDLSDGSSVPDSVPQLTLAPANAR